MRLIRLSSLLLLLSSLALSAACSSRSSTDQLKEGLRGVASWAATAHMVGEAWMGGRVPTAYARRTLLTAQQRVQEEAAQLEQSSSSADDRLTKALDQIQNLEATIEEMLEAVQAGDRASLAEQVKQLAAEEQTIKTLEQSLGGQP